MKIAGGGSTDRTRRLSIAAAVAMLLLVPLAAMQFTDEVAWTLFDFAVAAALLCGAGVAYELARSWTSDPTRRRIAAAAIVVAAAVIWAHGAVGLFD